MVSKKRLDYGFNGFQAPVIPRAPRSIRKKSPRKKLAEENELCAFELLATVAGKLLQESESSACSNAGEGKVHIGIHQDGFENAHPKHDNALKSESFDHRSCAESAFIPELSIQERTLLLSNLDKSSAHTSSGLHKNVENVPETPSEDVKNRSSDISAANISTTKKDPIAEHVNNSILITMDSSVQLPMYSNSASGALRLENFNNVKIRSRDDDENSFGCSKFSTKIRSFKPQPNIGNRRIRKILTSKYWKAALKLKSCALYDTSEGRKSFYRHRRNIYARERCQTAPAKRRKLVDDRFSFAYVQDNSSESISNLPDKRTSGDKNSSTCAVPSVVKGHPKSKDPRVKFSIKSFRVPELYIEVPQTATVDSLKRTVLEAVTAILGGGIRVGVVLQGKKVRDENRTLQQAGISQTSNLDFILEPSFTHVSPSITPKKLPSLLPCDTDQQLPRSPVTPNLESGVSNVSDLPVVNKQDEDVGNESIPFPDSYTSADAITDGLVYSKALVPVDSLALVPVSPKPKRNESSQRRTRRPFSVAEVEALVESVENLGTGRWRDVKKRAFENADHRTYVDLKDKWKTLVHTASISPQQRRGEPVPQELLNRVLSAHGYWSRHLSKQHHSVEPLNISVGD